MKYGKKDNEIANTLRAMRDCVALRPLRHGVTHHQVDWLGERSKQKQKDGPITTTARDFSFPNCYCQCPPWEDCEHTLVGVIL